MKNNFKAIFALLFIAVLFYAATPAGAGEAHQKLSTKVPPTTRVITTANGVVRGRIIRAGNGQYAQEFLNIPYAQPPVGELRFQPPKPVANWQNERDATKLGHACVQSVGKFRKISIENARFQITADPKTISEDCLTINIHTPYSPDENQSSSLIPVLVWIHGGAFQWGANNVDAYNASILATETNTIVAVINYRLGAFGFFTLVGVGGVKGNQGMLDQVLAIRWIRDNAQHFGGDAEKITLFGESAGGASVQYHMFSPLSRNMFARGIMQSGTAVSPWAHHTLEKARVMSRAFAAVTGCSGDDRSVFDCFHAKTTAEIQAVGEMIETKDSNVVKLSPTVDGIFMEKSPIEYLKSNDFKQAPAMIGAAANESLLVLTILYPDIVKPQLPDVQLTEQQFSMILENMTALLGKAPRDAIKFQYRDWNVALDAAERWRILNAVVDDMFMNYGLIETLDAYEDANIPIYRFQLDSTPSVSMWDFAFAGATHLDDVPFFFGHPLNPKYSYSVKDVDLSRRIMYAVGEFARTGKPSSSGDGETSSPSKNDVTWLPYAGHNEYFSFDTKEYGKIRVSPERWRREFWRQVVPYLMNLEARANANRADTTEKPSVPSKSVKPQDEL